MKLQRVLRKHWLLDTGAGHIAPICACLEHLGDYPSLGLAVDAWIAHVQAELDASCDG